MNSVLIRVIPNITGNATSARNGVTVAGDDTNGQVVAGGKGLGNRTDQLNYPSDVLIDKVTDSFIICDQNNRRVVRWSRRNSPTQGEILINNIFCYGLFMDDQRYLYVSDIGKHE
ncbi:unnamed protein product, partial [Rotaria magnacalcarata]